MSTIAAIMDAMAEQLEDTLTPPDGIVLHIEPRAFAIAETPAVDMLVANPTGLEQGLAGFGSHTIYGAFPITLRVRVGTADVIAGEDLLLAMIDDEGPMSIVAGLDSDRTLGGVCDYLTWGEGFPWTGYQDFPMSDGNGVLLGSTMAVVVIKTQS
jgi:hypothetical protein